MFYKSSNIFPWILFSLKAASFVAVGGLLRTSRSGTWAEELKTEAAELFDLVAVKVRENPWDGRALAVSPPVGSL